mmetsp:Transcript_57090/g.105551  ORF Transcript_57090/g.105551 Transcript_57090/m.105551 type:complete len:216 (+) Transcript_57090:1624-2271(+)
MTLRIVGLPKEGLCLDAATGRGTASVTGRGSGGGGKLGAAGVTSWGNTSCKSETLKRRAVATFATASSQAIDDFSSAFTARAIEECSCFMAAAIANGLVKDVCRPTCLGDDASSCSTASSVGAWLAPEAILGVAVLAGRSGVSTLCCRTSLVLSSPSCKRFPPALPADRLARALLLGCGPRRCCGGVWAAGLSGFTAATLGCLISCVAANRGSSM